MDPTVAGCRVNSSIYVVMDGRSNADNHMHKMIHKSKIIHYQSYIQS